MKLSHSSWCRPVRSMEWADRDVIEALNAVVENYPITISMDGKGR